MISDKDAKKWLAELELQGAELQTIKARLMKIESELASIREKLL